MGGDPVLQAARLDGEPVAGLEQVAADQQHGVGAVEIQATGAAFDFGDAPNPYPIAQHQIDANGPFLGTVPPDAEASTQRDAAAQGDDNNGTDDEECCSFTSNSGSFRVRPGEAYEIRYHVNGFGFANVWVDLNRDGDWDDFNSQLQLDEHVVIEKIGLAGVIAAQLDPRAAEG